MFRRGDNHTDNAEPDAASGGGEVFLGGLAAVGGARRSDLPPRFAALASAVGDLFDDYRTGELGPVEFAEALATRRIVDSRDVEWTIGATSGGWFRRDATGAWVASVPPSSDDFDAVDPLERLLASVDLSDDPEFPAPEPVVVELAAVPEPELAGTDSPLDTWGVPTEHTFEVAAPQTDAWADVVASPADLAEPLPEPAAAPVLGADPIAALEAAPVADAAPEIAGGWDDFVDPIGSIDDADLGPVEPAPPVRRGEGDQVWGAASTFDPSAAAPNGRTADGIDGESQWLNGSTDADEADPLAGL